MSFDVSRQPDCPLGCHAGIVMDDDEYYEGYQRDVVYPPCECHPKHCNVCGGTGWCPPEIAHTSDDCPKCDGTGWLGAPEHPDDRYEREAVNV